MSDDNPLNVALREVFGPVVKLTHKLPPILAYGLAIVVSLLVVGLLGATLPDNIVWLLGLIIFLCLLAFIFTDWQTRRPQVRRMDTNTRPAAGLCIIYVVVHRQDDQSAVISAAQVTLALPEPVTKETGPNGATNFSFPGQLLGHTFSLNASKAGYGQRNPLRIKLKNQGYFFVDLIPTTEGSENRPQISISSAHNQGTVSGPKSNIFYDSNEEPFFESWSLYSTAGGFSSRIIQGKRHEDGVNTIDLKAFGGELVGVNKSIGLRRGKVEFEYNAVSSFGDIPNMFFYMIPMQEPRFDGSGMIEVGTEAQDDIRNIFNPLRQRFIVPVEHVGDGKWHKETIIFDFRGITTAFYSIFAPRINEGSSHVGPAHLSLTKVRVFSLYDEL